MVEIEQFGVIGLMLMTVGVAVMVQSLFVLSPTFAVAQLALGLLLAGAGAVLYLIKGVAVIARSFEGVEVEAFTRDGQHR